LRLHVGGDFLQSQGFLPAQLINGDGLDGFQLYDFQMQHVVILPEFEDLLLDRRNRAAGVFGS